MVFTIEGPFTEEEAVAILQKIRDIHQARPEIDIKLTLLAPELTTADVRRLMAQVKPPFSRHLELSGQVFNNNLPFSKN